MLSPIPQLLQSYFSIHSFVHSVLTWVPTMCQHCAAHFSLGIVFLTKTCEEGTVIPGL